MKKMLIPVAAALLLSIAYATNLPELKEGLWSVHTQTINNPGNVKREGTYTLCRNHAFDQAAEARAKSMKNCTMVSENFEGGKYSSQMHCVAAGTVIETKGTNTFQGDTSFHSESHATYTPPLSGITEMTIIVDQRYAGSCPVGTEPGDRTNSDGTVIHLGKH